MHAFVDKGHLWFTATIVWGNPWGPVVIFCKTLFLISSKSTANLRQKTVGYPSRKGVHHIFFERQKYGLITAYHRRKDVKYLTSQRNIKIFEISYDFEPLDYQLDKQKPIQMTHRIEAIKMEIAEIQFRWNVY